MSILLPALGRMLLHGASSMATVARTGQFPSFLPNLQKGLVSRFRAASLATKAIQEVQYDEAFHRAGPPLVQLRGRLTSDFTLKLSPDGYDQYGEAELCVSYMKGGQRVEDIYQLDVDGPMLQEVLSRKLGNGSYVAVQGELFMEKVEVGPDMPDKQVAIVAVDMFKHSPEWSPELAASMRTAREARSPGPAQPGGAAAKQQSQPVRMDADAVAALTLEEKWQHLRDNPNNWWDNRTSKMNPKSPDFKLKVKAGGPSVGLWVDSKSTPDWAREQYGPVPTPQ